MLSSYMGWPNLVKQVVTESARFDWTCVALIEHVVVCVETSVFHSLGL